METVAQDVKHCQKKKKKEKKKRRYDVKVEWVDGIEECRIILYS